MFVSFSKFTVAQVASKMETIEKDCDNAELIAREPEAISDETYAQDSEALLQAVEY